MADEKKRKDRLSEVDLTGSEDEEPQVYALKREGSGWALSRRGFLAAAATAAAATLHGGRLEGPSQIAAQEEVQCDNVFAHTDGINALAISPDGKLLASGSGDKTIKLWSLPEGALIKTLKGHTDSVLVLAISPDGKRLASGSADKTICL